MAGFCEPDLAVAAHPGHAVGADAVPVLLMDVGRRCGLLLADVREVHRVVRSVDLPEAPPVVEGVINVRGDVVPVLDFRARLGLSTRPVEMSDRLVVVHVAGRRLALRVDSVTDLIQIAASAVQPAEVLPGVAHLAGVATLPDGLLLIHDLAALLSAEDGVALDQALAALASDDQP